MNMNRRRRSNPRILIVTPEITYLPNGMGNMSNVLQAKAGGLADVSASLVSALYRQGADVHVALPHYRRMFNIDVGRLINHELRVYMSHLSNSRIHLAEDRVFYYRDSVYSNYSADSFRFAMAFQREVINNIIPKVEPDLIHCNDWMTGLIPPMARRLGIPCLFTVHNIHTQKMMLEAIEDRGIDAAEFWENLYFERQPYNYEETRDSNPVDLLASGIFASHYINTVSPTFLHEIVDGRHDFVPENIRHEIAGKTVAGCALGILNAPDSSFNPANDKYIKNHFTAEDVAEGKKRNKLEFQRRCGLMIDPEAPILFWPSRLDPVQKGCQLLTDILYHIVSKYWKRKLQVAIVANGSYQQPFRDIVRMHDMHERVTVCDFDEKLSHLGYAASDFMLMPSLFEPCGLPQMISPLYGTLPVVHDTGGLHDTVKHLDVAEGTGNGFVFETYDTGGLVWGIDEAMRFYNLPDEVKYAQIARIMEEAKAEFNHDVTAQRYMDIYESMLKRPLVP
ncbi:glycogen/starch synthase [Lentisphaerota bacterium ZTH]|nr:glycogen/starch synthase [Lentisphaerota bacterium ZTH]